MPTPIVGTVAKVDWTKTGGTLLTLANQNWKLNVKNNVGTTSNTVDGINRVAGLEDYDGTIEGFLDTSDVYDADISSGDTGVFKLYRDATKFFSIQVIITSIEEMDGTEDPTKYTISFSKWKGVITEPL